MIRYISVIVLMVFSAMSFADAVASNPGNISLLGVGKVPGARWGICGYTSISADFSDVVYATVDSADPSATYQGYWFPRKLYAGASTFTPVCVSTTNIDGTSLSVVLHRKCPAVPTPACPGLFGPPIGVISVALRNGYPH